MKKIVSLMLCVILTFSCVVSVGAYNFSNNGTAIQKATAYRLPSVNSGDVWWVDKNDKLQVFCQDGDYYLVLYPFNNTGKHVIAYVPTSAVSASGIPNASNFYKNEIVRTKSNANLYHNPSTDTLTGASGSNQTVRTTVSKGQELTVLFEKDGFYCVRTSNDTGFIEKNKICTHSNTSNKNEKITVAKKDDNTHTVTTAYDEVCNDCGKTVKSNQKKTNSEKHAISNDKCTKCGYEAPVIEEKCNHSNTKENWQSSTVSQKDDTYHTVEEIYDVLCADCGETIKKLQNKVYDEKHILKNDDCEKCSYVVPGSEAAKCKHTNTAKHSSEDMKTTISIKDDNQHTIASYYHVWCTDCFTYIKENELDLVHENHTFINNICSVCNLEKFVEKTAYVYNTDGDNLNMRSQANSSSSIVVKIPAGATLTVTGDAINGFYPIKYSGKTGYASTAYITFTKPSVNKTAYVYNTDGANLNMRSSANKNASIVTKMPEGSTLTVTGDSTNGFYPVKYGNYSGYASTAYITFTKPVNTNANQSLSNIRTSAPEKNNKYYYSNSNVFYASGLAPYGSRIPSAKGNCTWYAWGRAHELTGTKPQPGLTGNAYTWWNGAAGKYSRGSTPKVGAIAVWKSNMPYSGGCGHVAIVEKIENGKVYISESGYPNTLFKYREIYSTNYLYGYIYIK